jgi:hypothetical protein
MLFNPVWREFGDSWYYAQAAHFDSAKYPALNAARKSWWNAHVMNTTKCIGLCTIGIAVALGVAACSGTVGNELTTCASPTSCTVFARAGTANTKAKPTATS